MMRRNPDAPAVRPASGPASHRGTMMAAVALALALLALLHSPPANSRLEEEQIASACNMYRMQATTQHLRPLWITDNMRQAMTRPPLADVSCAEMREGEVRAVVLTEHDPQERAIRARTSRSHPPEVVASLIALPLFRDLALLASHNELGFAHTCGSPHMDVPKDDLLTPGRCSEHCWVFVFNERNAGCGSGIVDVGEECDDANDFSGDGCSRTCQVEPGYQCWHSFSHPASVCYRDGDDRGSLLPSRRPSVSRWDMARAGYALSVSLLVLSALLFVAILGIALAIVMEPRLKDKMLEWLTQGPQAPQRVKGE